MKRILLFLLLFACNLCVAQNYQCLQGGVKHYFTNADGYLRGIRIDSVKPSGSTVLYYPYQSTRKDYNTGSLYLGGSWLGSQVRQLSDGTFLFDNMWHDTVFIKTQAHVGDTWKFYNDTTGLYYMAEVTSTDTMTVLGMPDSVKTILITAHNPSGIVTSDSANGLRLILSKNNGFVQIIDLFTFPYHAADTAYKPGNDYYLDYLVGAVDFVFLTYPVAAKSTFSLVPLINPTYAQLYDWNIGDVFENSYFSFGVASDGSYPFGYYFDSIVGKNPVPGGVQFSYTGWQAQQHFSMDDRFRGHDPFHQYPYDTGSSAGSFVVSNDILLDTTLMPEEKNIRYFLYYKPNDTSNCLPGPLYNFTELNYGLYEYFESAPLTITYKTGIGLVNYYEGILGSPPSVQDTTLLYFVKSGVPCGTFTYPSPINNLVKVNDVTKAAFHVLPNPVHDELTIVASCNITTICITNLLGQVLYSQNYNAEKATISVADLPQGIYLLKVNNAEVRKFVKE
jgi:hypothetical protein